MKSLFRERIHPLKNNSVVKLNFSFSFAIKFAFISLSSLRVKNWSSPKVIISSVYILMILNKIPVIIIRKHRLNIKVVINSFFL
jgi:hypothetical protein